MSPLPRPVHGFSVAINSLILEMERHVTVEIFCLSGSRPVDEAEEYEPR